MKSTKSTHKTISKFPKYSQPDEELVSWFHERLELEKEKTQFQPRIKGGGKLPISLQKKLNRSAARKTELLDDVIFRSLANLIYFFEVQSRAPRLRKLFEKDVIDLLDPRFVDKNVENMSMGLNTTSYAFRTNSLSRLISTALAIDDRNIKNGTIVKDFRIALLFQLQMIIRDYVDRVFSIEFGFSNQIAKSAKIDFDKTVGWLALIAKSSSEDSEKELDRTMGFEPIWHSTKSDRLRRILF